MGFESPRLITPIAERRIAELLKERPDLNSPRYESVVQAWGVAVARCELYQRFADRVGEIDEETADALPFTVAWRRVQAEERECRKELGIGPLYESKLATARAEASLNVVDLSEMAEIGRRFVRRSLEIAPDADEAADE